MITVEHEGVVCRFDDTGIDRERPGLIAGALLKGVFYEQPFLQYIRSLEVPGVYVDIGAAIGTHTIYFAMLCNADRVYAFEPLRHNFDRLNSNLTLNNLTDRVVPMKLAVSDQAGEMRLTLAQFSEVVPTDRLDNLIHEPVSVIKIDVEGMEPQVLRGMGRILTTDRPRIFAEAGTAAELAGIRLVLGRYGYGPTGRVFNSTPTYEFTPIPTDTIGRRIHVALLKVNRSPLGALVKRLTPTRWRRRVMRRLRG